MPPARRAAVLIDAACYFARLEEALKRAERSILITGWDFDGSIRLRADGEDGSAKLLGELLRSLVETRPDLEIRILVWSLAVIHAPGAALPLLFGAAWQEHPRIQLRLDNKHPIYAAHHQKLVCIDDVLAFVGGIDLTVRRWDTSEHAPEHAARVSPDGNAYGPVHDLQIVVDGEAARAAADLVRDRWCSATGETPAPVAVFYDPWPPDLQADFTDTPVAIARTAPASGDIPAIGEVAALTADALSAARRSIYIEAQYLTAASIGDLLVETLAKQEGPEIVAVVTRASRGLIERVVMGGNRDRLVRRLKQADRLDRLRVYYPVVPTADGECEVLIHSKLLIIDDEFIRIGSSNLNNRSVGLDTECDVAIEASREQARQAIAHIRDRLLSEHLGVGPAAFATAVATEGSLIKAVESLNTNRRGLRLLPAVDDEDGPTTPIPGTTLLDPQKPFEPLSFLRSRDAK